MYTPITKVPKYRKPISLDFKGEMSGEATVMAGAVQPRISEAETGDLREFEATWSTRSVSGQPGLRRETVFQEMNEQWRLECFQQRVGQPDFKY